MTPTAPRPLEWRAKNGLEFMTWPGFDDLPVDVVITTRHGGVSEGAYATLNLGLHVGDSWGSVVENRERAAKAAGAELTDLVFANQTHGRGVFIVTAADKGRGTTSLDDAISGVDAFVTAHAGVVIVTMVADCAPIVLYDPRAQVAAAVHAGWRGTVAQVSDAAVTSMISLGSHPSDIIAAIGPAANPDTYQVGPEVAEQVATCLNGATDGVLKPHPTSGFLFDISEANRRLLQEVGIEPANILSAGVSTGRGTPFFSDRAARPCGRFAAFVRLHPPGQRGA